MPSQTYLCDLMVGGGVVIRSTAQIATTRQGQASHHKQNNNGGVKCMHIAAGRVHCYGVKNCVQIAKTAQTICTHCEYYVQWTLLWLFGMNMARYIVYNNTNILCGIFSHSLSLCITHTITSLLLSLLSPNVSLTLSASLLLSLCTFLYLSFRFSFSPPLSHRHSVHKQSYNPFLVPTRNIKDGHLNKTTYPNILFSIFCSLTPSFSDTH